MDPWEEMLRLLAEEPEMKKRWLSKEEEPEKPKGEEFEVEKSQSPKAEPAQSPKSREQSVTVPDRLQGQQDGARENSILFRQEDSQLDQAATPKKQENGPGRTGTLFREQTSRTSGGKEKEDQPEALISHLRPEITGESGQPPETIHSLGKTAAESKKEAGLTEEQVLALLDRYLTEEFLAMGGELLGND